LYSSGVIPLGKNLDIFLFLFNAILKFEASILPSSSSAVPPSNI